MRLYNTEGKPVCPPKPLGCGKEINPLLDFKDELSAREYTISGLCQECQDEFFCSGEGCTKPCCKD